MVRRVLHRVFVMWLVVGMVVLGGLPSRAVGAMTEDLRIYEDVAPHVRRDNGVVADQSMLDTASDPITPTIRLQSRQFVPGAPEVGALRKMAQPKQDRVHVLLQLDFIPRQTAKEALASRGLHLLAYVPDYAWIASVPADDPTMVLRQPGVTWAGPLTIEDKLDPAITKGIWGEYNLSPDGTAAVYVMLHKDEQLEAGRILVAAHGGKISGEVVGINTLLVEMPRDNIRMLAAEDAVQWIEAAAPPLGEANDGSRDQNGVSVLHESPYALDGTGVDVLVYDSGQVGDHPDFDGRLIHGDADGVSDHSTHVAGTVGADGGESASAGGSSEQWRGMAPAADIISYGYQWSGIGMLFYDNPGDIENDWAEAQNSHGADVGNASLSSNIYLNSYPCDRMGNYGVTSALMDQIVRGANSVVGIGDKFIATWAVGNERPSTCSASGYRTTSPPANAKNPIHVGAANTDNDSMTSFSSWGPTDDGRIKPLVVAGGDQVGGDGAIKSTIADRFTNTSWRDCDGSGDDYCYPYDTMQGTSMAAPAVAGSIALLLQHYRDVYGTAGNFWPSTARAILMQTAQDMGNPGPDYQWGYGLVDIQSAVDLISRRAFRQDSVDADDVDVFSLVVPDDAQDVIVSLAWDDVEATVNAASTLYNDLDLELEAPDGTLWRPWVLDAGNPNDNATRGGDSVNNQEQVLVPAANVQIGTWLVRVWGTTVPDGPQDYTLACEGCKPLDLGVCQAQVSGTPLLHKVTLEAEVLPVGETWQRSLEAVVPEAMSPDFEADVSLRVGLAELAAAQAAGPAAVLALLDTLTGEARDLAMAEIVEAHARLPKILSEASTLSSVREIDEADQLAAQRIVETSNRVQALTLPRDLNEGLDVDVMPAMIPQFRPAAPGADLTVGTGCTFPTIAAAIAAAQPGDHLLIEGGRTFVENLVVPISLTLQGGYDGCDSASSTPTTIDGGASGPVLIIAQGLQVTLKDLDITNGLTSEEGGGVRFAMGDAGGTLNLTDVSIYENTAAWGGGLWVGRGAEVTGTGVEIHNNTGMTYGGGLRLFGGHVTLEDSNVHHNLAPLGGGVYASKEFDDAPTLNLASYADVYDNQALSGSGLGGGLYVREGTVLVTEGSDLYSNDAIQGGGAYLVTSTLTIQGTFSEIETNSATGSGGGVYVQGGTVNLDDDAELYYNDAGTDGTGSGGGLYLDDGNLYADKAAIRYNNADDYGGGVYATNGSVVDMDLGSYTCLGTQCSRLSNNTASDLYGGGIYADDSTVSLDNTFVQANTASFGGGIYARASEVGVRSSLIARNDATSGTGDGVRLYSGALFDGAGNTVAYNDAGGTNTGRAIDVSDSSLTLSCSILWGHTSAINLAGQAVTYSDVQGGYVGEGNLNVDPQFVAPGSADFHLQSSSPVVDRCVSGQSTDFENERRPIIRVTGAAPYDMGADEVSGAARVGVNGSCAYATIQQAVNAAEDGDTVRIAEGVYFENVDLLHKDITLAGGYDDACTTPGSGATRLEGSVNADNVLDVFGGVLTLRDLEITWGSGFGGGIYAASGAQITLDDVQVQENHGSVGGGMYINSGCAVTLTTTSDLHDNTASASGGGAVVYGRLSGADSAKVYANCASDGGGLAVPGGDLTLDNVDVYDNEAADAAGKGGGIYVTANGRVDLHNGVFVGGTSFANQRAYDGGGIYADRSTVILTDVNLGRNSATNNGGGLALFNGSVLQATDTRLGYHARVEPFTFDYGNSATLGGGLYASESQVGFDGSIAANQAMHGGGVYGIGADLSLVDTTVGREGISPGNTLVGTNGYGAGLYLNATSATLKNTVIISNTFESTGVTYGGGLYVRSGSVLTLTDSQVMDHIAPSSSNGRGGGLYVTDSTITLDQSDVLSNTAGTVGGGLRMFGSSTLNALNASSISYNRSLNGEGGGIAATGTPDVTISGTTFYYNHASTDGGAVHLDAGTLDFDGNWDLRWNHAGGNGGAVAVLGSGDVDFSADSGASYLAVNTASNNGGALYVGNADDVALHATDGYRLHLNTNSASGSGGAMYADGGASFDLLGRVQASSNVADGDGGVCYLAGGARVDLVAYEDDAPQILVNRADNGGAIYAVDSPGVVCEGATFGTTTNGNQATSGSGGAIYLENSTLTAQSCTFRHSQASTYGGAIYNGGSVFQVDRALFAFNTASRGGAVYQVGSGADSQLNNSLIYSNTTTASLGAGIRTEGGSFTLTHVTLADNLNGAGYSQASTDSAVHNSIIWGNESAGFLGDYVTRTCSIDQSGNVGAAIDPQFVAPGDYRLRGDSPAVDACAAGLGVDLEGVLRPISLGYDMGAYEYPYGVALAPDRLLTALPARLVTATHTLTNTGGVSDFYTITLHSDHDWTLSVTPSLPVVLPNNIATTIAVSIEVPTAVPSGTVDTVVVTATSGTDPKLTASAIDTVTVAFSPGARFTPDHLTIGAAEATVYTYTHWLTNTGNATDTFDLLLTTSAGWGNLDTVSPITLDMGTSAPVTVLVTVPVGGSDLSDQSRVVAASRAGGDPVAVLDVTSAFTPGVALTPDITQTVSSETVLTYTHTLTNVGDATDTFSFSVTTDRGWAALLTPGPFTLAPGVTQTVRVRVIVPPGSGGLTETTTVTATSVAGAGPVSVRDTTGVFRPGVAFAPDYEALVAPGDTITYTHRLTNTGEGPDLYTVGVVSSTQGWATLLDGGPFVLDAGVAVDVRARIDVPSGSGGLVDVTVISATSRASAGTVMVTDTSRANRAYGVELVPDHTQSVTAPTVVTYTHQLHNTGNGADMFALTLSSDLGWATLLDGGPIPLDADATSDVRVRVAVPEGTGGLSDVLNLVATSQTSTTVSARVTDTIHSLYVPGVRLSPDVTVSALPGEILTHTHWLTNTGNGSDRFDLALSASQGWSALLEGEVFILDAGEAVSFSVRTSVPLGTGGLLETALISATASAGGITDVVTDTTSVTQLPALTLTPDYAESVKPGQERVYLHTLQNIGNGRDTFSVTFNSSLGWATLLDVAPITLDAGETHEVEVRVSVPTGLISGTASDITVLTATSYADFAVQAAAVDTTTVGFAPGMLFEGDELTIGAIPDDVFTYTHVLTNTGNYTDTFVQNFVSGLGWGELLDAGPWELGVGDSTTLHVVVTVPPGGLGRFDHSVVTVTSVGGAGPLAVRDTTAAFMPGVVLAPSAMQTVDPGDVLTYVHTLTNTGTSTDTLVLTLDSSQGWATIRNPGPYTIASGDAITVGVVLTVPLGSGGLKDVSVVQATSLEGAGPSARVTDTTTVRYVPGIALAPNAAQTVPPGSAVIYTHHLTNTGNGPDTFSISLNGSQGWGAVLDGGPFDLIAGDAIAVRVAITVPLEAYAFSKDITTLTATSAIGGLSAAVVDTTTVACVPVVGPEFNYDPSPAVFNRPTTFTGDVVAGSLPITYTWDFGDGNPLVSGNPVVHTFIVSDTLVMSKTFTVRAMVQNLCSGIVTVTHEVQAVASTDVEVYLPLVLRRD